MSTAMDIGGMSDIGYWMDIGRMSDSSVPPGNIGDSPVIASAEDRSLIEISELDKLLGLPPPRFGLGSTDIDSFKALDPASSSCNFDAEIDFAVPQKPSLPERLKLGNGRENESEIEICYNKDLTKVSVIKSELNIESDGQEIESECNSYLSETVPMLPSPSAQGDMLYKRFVGRGRGSRGSLSRVVSRLLAKGEPLHTILSPNSVCDTPVPKNPISIPPPVINKLKKLGTSVEVEKPNSSSLYTINRQVAVVPEIPSEPSTNSPLPAAPNSITTGYLEIMETLDKAVGLTSDLTKKKKKRMQKRNANIQVPSSAQLLAEIENSDNLTKFSFQVDAKQIRELPDGQKLFTCDICSGVYHRGFSLKRHYLKTHINYKHISKRDLHNCGILLDPSIEKGGARKKQLIKDDSPPVVTNLSPPSDIPDLYRCHTCLKCFMLISDLQAHLMDHPPVSVQNMTEDQLKSYTCPKCKARYQKKKLYLIHKEMCGTMPESETVNAHFCLFCDKTFSTFVQKKLHHLQMHHPKKRLHQCYLCKTKMFKERIGVFKHLVLHHPDEYIGCISCKLRFATRDDFKRHNKENHKPIGTAKKLIFQETISDKKEDNSNFVVYDTEVEQHAIPVNNIMTSSNPDLIWKCTDCPKMFASHLNMTRHRRLAHFLHPRAKKRRMMQKKQMIVSGKVAGNCKTTTPPPSSLQHTPPPPPTIPPTDPEVLFYSTIAHNIRENLTHHLDGKLDSQEIMEYDLNKSSSLRNKVLNFSASFTSGNTSPVPPEASSTPVQPKESRSTPISPRGQWEKFNFPKNYDGRCGLSSYIKDMSHLDISTQLTMRRNLQRLNSTAGQESCKESPANIPAGLLLVERPGPDCAETFGDPEDNKDKGGTEATVLSGEWVRPRTYLCAACGFKSTNLWDVEDHKYALHPNVWVPHVEIVGEQSSAWDWFYHRRLPPDTLVEDTTPTPPVMPPPCSKCGRPSPSFADLHRHMLDCGGDTTWAATMLAVTSPGSRRRKWRPFGSRRRKQTGRRGLKRNIPNTPAKHSCGRIRTKPGDMDTIQKMIANLPPKRATRRVIGEEVDIKTRSQATISSIPISSVGTHSSIARSNAVKSSKLGKTSSKLNPKKLKVEYQFDGQSHKKDNLNIKEEPIDEVAIKEETSDDSFYLESENTVQHSDILTSLQMIPVIRTNPAVTEVKQSIVEEPIETSKIIAAMREAMLDSEDKEETIDRITEKKKKKKGKQEDKIRRMEIEDKVKKMEIKTEDKVKKVVATEVKKPETDLIDIIICNGCGMQFDNMSACQRHKKKCVYWKEDKTCEDIKNKCINCGSTFPYLMALLKHNCKVDTAEEPVMPELCPVIPVEEVQCNSVEEIPILSPVGITKDDSAARRVSLLEETINRVGQESFDVSCYMNKLLNSQNSNKNAEFYNYKTIKKECSMGSSEKNNISTLFKSEQTDKQLLLNNSTTMSVANESNKEMSKSQNSVEKVNLPLDKHIPRNKKVSDMFKEIKRRGRRRQKMRAKIVPKTVSKLGLRKAISKTQGFNAKRQMSAKKRRKRSSNFVMLMKEWEKLEKEGAVAVGKRKRLLTRNDLSIVQGRTRRRFINSYPRSDYVDSESIFTDTSSLYDHVTDSSQRRRSRRTNSIGSLYDICSDNVKEESETLLSIENASKNEGYNTNDVSTSVVKEESSLLKRKRGRPRKTNTIVVSEKPQDKNLLELNTSNDHSVVTLECNYDDKEGLLYIKQVMPLQKRKPGRPRTQSIAVVSEKPQNTGLVELKKSSQNSEIKVEHNDDEIKDKAIQQEVFLQKRKPGRPRTSSIIVNRENPDTIGCTFLNKSSEHAIIKVEHNDVNNIGGKCIQQEVSVQKRKPGRPRASSIIINGEKPEVIGNLGLNKSSEHAVIKVEHNDDYKEGKSKQLEMFVQKRKPGRPRASSIAVSSEKPEVIGCVELNKSSEHAVIKVEHDDDKEGKSKQQEMFVQKRKPGRPRAPSITVETEQHILETIDLIVRGSMENINSEVKAIKDETNNTPEKKCFQQHDRTLSGPIKTEDNISQTIEEIVNESKDHMLNKEDTKWFSVDEVIYNVSIGSADIFEKQNNEILNMNISTADQITQKRKRGRRSKQLLNGTPDPIECFPSSTFSSINLHETISPSQKQPEKCDLIDVIETDNHSNKLETNIAKVKSEDVNKNCSSHQMFQGKRKSTFAKDEIVDKTMSDNCKLKKVKTKQLSIADYLSKSYASNKPSETASKEKLCKNNETVSQILSNFTDLVKEGHQPNASVLECSVVKGIMENNLDETENKKHKNHFESYKPHSPCSTSSKEDVALSVIREKVIQKKKKKLKLKKLLKNKRLEIIDSKLSKITKHKLPLRANDRYNSKEKLRKIKKQRRVGVSRNHWEVSIVENKSKPVEILCEEESKSVHITNVISEPVKRFYCSYCDKKFESAFNLYEHQMTPSHKLKSTPSGDSQNNISEENDPVKYCKSIGNIINDLEKRTLNVAKVMQHLKQRDSTETANEATVDVVEPKSSGTKESKSSEEGWQQEWPSQQDWSSRSSTPLWEGANQSWEVDSLSTGCNSSLGSIMDTVNKLLSSDQELVSSPTLGNYSWSDLQLAMGASDEEMAMLEQLGEHSLQEEYVYDNSRPLGDWPQSEDSPTLTDLDHPEQSTSHTPSPTPATSTPMEVKKQEPLSDSEESKVCRGAIGRPRRMLGDYENKEMVCPTCNKHFLGLPALQTHVSWSHCTNVGNSSRLVSGLKRRALLSGDKVDLRLVCFVCKEIVPSANLLESHIQAQHTKRQLFDQDPPKPTLSESAERLKSKMSLALGGLVDRALDKLLGSNMSSPPSQSDVNTGALQLLGRICAARKRVGSENIKLSTDILQLLGRLRQVSQKEEGTSRSYNTALANEMRAILSRGKPIGVSKGALQASVSSSSSPNTVDLKPTNLLDHLAVCSSDVQERPYACPICDHRFLIPSTRNRHIARAHGKYGRRYDEEAEDFNGQDDLDSGWKDTLESCIEANDDGEMLPLCSDCGLSFQTIHEVMKHRIEDHPRRFSADGFQDNKTSVAPPNFSIVESSSETKISQERIKSEDVKSLPVSDNAIDSTSTIKKKRGRPPKLQDQESEKKHNLNCSLGNQNQLKDTSLNREDIVSSDYETDSLCESNGGESNSQESSSPESQKISERNHDGLSSQNSSEENLAELSKKLDRRKVRVGNMAVEAVRVKAEAALRELNLLTKNKSPSSAAKWGINAMKFTKQPLAGVSTGQINGSPTKPRFASLVDKKWKMPSTSAMQLQVPKKEILEDVKPDIYDFNDEDMDTNKKPFQQLKDSQQEPEHSEGNKCIQSPNCYTSGSPKKPNFTNKLNSDNS